MKLFQISDFQEQLSSRQEQFLFTARICQGRYKFSEYRTCCLFCRFWRNQPACPGIQGLLPHDSKRIPCVLPRGEKEEQGFLIEEGSYTSQLTTIFVFNNCSLTRHSRHSSAEYIHRQGGHWGFKYRPQKITKYRPQKFIKKREFTTLHISRQKCVCSIWQNCYISYFPGDTC